MFSLCFRLQHIIDLQMEIDEITKAVIGVACKIHTKVGPGCLERVYEELMFYELIKLRLQVSRQICLPIQYEGLYIQNAYRLDLLVENQLIVELKVVYPLPPVFFDQVRTHLSLLNLKHGLLLNFKVSHMKEGIHRVFNNQGRLMLT
jgi:GxxExxY protein